MIDLDISPFMKDEDSIACVTSWIGPISHLFSSFIHRTTKLYSSLSPKLA